MGKRLLILGANRYNLLSAREARAAGFFTLVADRNPAAPGLAEADVPLVVDVADVSALADAVRNNGGVDGVVSTAEVGVRPAAALARMFGLPGISEQAAANATSKVAMRRLWAGLGAWSPPFRVARTEEEALAAAEALKRYPLIVKPDRSLGGSRGVRRVSSPEEVPGAFAFARAGSLDGGQVVLEWCVEGSEHSCEVLIWAGEASVLCIGEKVKSPPPYRVDLSVQYPSRLGAGQEAEVQRMCSAAVAALGLTQGAAHVEFAMTGQGPVLFELGARCGGGHTPQIAREVTGVDEFVEACRMACGERPLRFRSALSRGADYRFLVFPPGPFRSAVLPTWTRRHPYVLDSAVTQGPGEFGVTRTTADRAGFVVIVADTREEAVILADEAVRGTEAAYEGGRRFSPQAMPNIVLARADVAAVVGRYQRRIAEHGATGESLASGSQEKQRARHAVHATALRGERPAVLEIGCGLGGLFEHLVRNGIPCDYTGYDIVPEYVGACQARFPGCRFELRNVLEEGIDGEFDSVLMSQVWNNRYSESDNWKVLQEVLLVAWRHTRVSVSVDLMSSYVDYENPDLFYYSPEEAFRVARRVARRVVLRHDYRPFEFCLQLFHDGVEGFTP